MTSRDYSRNPWRLSPRQMAVLDAIVLHKRNDRAAEALGITVRAVDASLARIRVKLIQAGLARRSVMRRALLELWIQTRAGL